MGTTIESDWENTRLLEELEAARAETEVERMRLAACGVVAMSNTPDSAAKAREMLPEYRSGSLEDVIRAVDSEMELREQLAAEQAKNMSMHEWMLNNSQHTDTCDVLCLDDDGRHLPCSCGLSGAISTPSDTSALEAMIAKAGEKMRERVVETILASAHGFPMREIRALPAVTLEDLK